MRMEPVVVFATQDRPTVVEPSKVHYIPIAGVLVLDPTVMINVLRVKDIALNKTCGRLIAEGKHRQCSGDVAEAGAFGVARKFAKDVPLVDFREGMTPEENLVGLGVEILAIFGYPLVLDTFGNGS